jgi:putative ubiquitin-RnfH superfamily antitoxin RatB of RatAB toxin-antitoxin module
MAEQNMVKIEVAYALPQQQKIITLEVPDRTTVFEAAQRSNITDFFVGLELSDVSMGIFGQLVKKPHEYCVREGQRVEIYRPLIIDPKVARANRAAKAKQRKLQLSNAVTQKLPEET